MKTSIFREVAGWTSMALGIFSIGFAVHACNAPTSESKNKSLTVAAAVGGGTLGLGVARRLLRESHEEEASDSTTIVD